MRIVVDSLPRGRRRMPITAVGAGLSTNLEMEILTTEQQQYRFPSLNRAFMNDVVLRQPQQLGTIHRCQKADAQHLMDTLVKEHCGEKNKSRRLAPTLVYKLHQQQ